MTTYYRADFASGHVEVRSTERRAYAACVIVRSPETKRVLDSSWCGTVAMAHGRTLRKGYPHETSEAVVEITAKEYRSIKQAS